MRALTTVFLVTIAFPANSESIVCNRTDTDLSEAFFGGPTDFLSFVLRPSESELDFQMSGISKNGSMPDRTCQLNWDGGVECDYAEIRHVTLPNSNGEAFEYITVNHCELKSLPKSAEGNLGPSAPTHVFECWEVKSTGPGESPINSLDVWKSRFKCEGQIPSP